MISQALIKRHALFFIPIVLFLAYLPASDLFDKAIASLFLKEHFHFAPSSFALFIYKYGLLPGQVLFASSILLFILSLSSKKWLSYRSIALFLTLTLLIGSVLFCNFFLKQYCPRPRPKQVSSYGGHYPYCSICASYKGPLGHPLRSFPCGHATMGFYFLSLFFTGIRLNNKKLSIFGLLSGTFFGSLLSYARLAQGGHFFSDILSSLIIMWSTAYWIDYLLYYKISAREFYQ